MQCVSQELDPEDAAELQLQVLATRGAAAAALDPTSIIATEVHNMHVCCLHVYAYASKNACM
jgi:hypothetical protein